jgi:hypothetical protein
MTMLIPFLLIALLTLILHWPFRWHRACDFLGRESGELRAALYHYAYGPTYDRLDYDGLRRLQGWLLLVITTVAGRIQPDLIAWAVETIRQAFGL